MSFLFLIESDMKISIYCSLEKVNFLFSCSCYKCCSKMTIDCIGLKSYSCINGSAERMTKYVFFQKYKHYYQSYTSPLFMRLVLNDFSLSCTKITIYIRLWGLGLKIVGLTYSLTPILSAFQYTHYFQFFALAVQQKIEDGPTRKFTSLINCILYPNEVYSHNFPKLLKMKILFIRLCVIK